jgi:membrane protease YdiL (CAAX protease family)
MAYAFNQFASKCGPWIALFLTVLLRTSHHLWKDPFMLALAAGHFFLAGLVYWCTRNLWPLIACHAVYDILLRRRR